MFIGGEIGYRLLQLFPSRAAGEPAWAIRASRPRDC